jgi:antitoxin component of MazEF toxin-antitoxin module
MSNRQFPHRTEALSCVDRPQAGGYEYDPTFYPIQFDKIDTSPVLLDDKCMKTTLSAKRQVSIPKQLCDELELEPGAQIAWEVQDSKLVGRPLPKEGWRSLIGKYKGGPDLVAALLKQRGEDREREDRKLAR